MTRSWRLLGGSLAALAALAVLAIPANAQSPAATDLMAEANARYDREEYAEAVLLYESLVEDGYHDTALYYNLGNAHLGSGDLGRAILSYLRAEDLSPRDPNIRANLELARGMTVDRVEFERISLIESVSFVGLWWFTVTEVGAVSLLLWMLSALSIGVLLIWRAFPLRAVLRTLAGAGVIATLASSLLLLSILFVNPYSNTGVVVVEVVEVLSGPGSQYPEEFIIHSGAQVQLVDSRQGWVMVELPGGGLHGWVPAHAIEPVGRADVG